MTKIGLKEQYPAASANENDEGIGINSLGKYATVSKERPPRLIPSSNLVSDDNFRRSGRKRKCAKNHSLTNFILWQSALNNYTTSFVAHTKGERRLSFQVRRNKSTQPRD
jgi:hypothetical protein